jgi:hypothetical protein
MARLTVLCALLVLVLPAGAQAQGGSTAKDFVEQMTELASGWRVDAVLTQIGAWAVHTDGTSDLGPQGWFYTFYSPGAKQWRLFQIGATGFVQKEVASAPTLPIPEGYLDSNEAMTYAVKSGFIPHEENLMLLGATQAKKVPEAVYWTVGRADQKTGPSSGKGYLLDPLTGKVVARN